MPLKEDRKKAIVRTIQEHLPILYPWMRRNIKKDSLKDNIVVRSHSFEPSLQVNLQRIDETIQQRSNNVSRKHNQRYNSLPSINKNISSTYHSPYTFDSMIDRSPIYRGGREKIMKIKKY